MPQPGGSGRRLRCPHRDAARHDDGGQLSRRVTTDEVKSAPPPAAPTREFDSAIEKSIAWLASRCRRDRRIRRLATNSGRQLLARVVPGDDRRQPDWCVPLRHVKPSTSTSASFCSTRHAATPGHHRRHLCYLISTLSMPMRAVLPGSAADSPRLRLIERASNFHGDNQSDARLVLVLLDNREARDAALEQLAQLRQQYPRNRLFWLPAKPTLLRASRAAEAERAQQ